MLTRLRERRSFNPGPWRRGRRRARAASVSLVMLSVGLIGALLWLAIGQSPTFAKGEARTASSASASVHWVEWSPEAFERAKREDKLILLDLTAIWCHACHVMDDTTYTDPGVAALLNERYVPIRVDTDKRPDIDIRYRHAGWPTTSVLLHTGEILFQANFLEADELTVVLEETEALYREQRSELFQRARAVWAKVEAAARSEAPHTEPIRAALVDQSAGVLRVRFDSQHGGFRDAPKFFEPDAVTFALQHAYWSGDTEFQAMALTTLKAQVRLEDPVWGGFYRYAESADWTQPHYEKLLEVQARNLRNYLEAFHATGDETYKEVALRTIAYVNEFLLSPGREGFYASQAAGVRSLYASTRRASEAEYYGLGDEERAALGMPLVDRRVYTSSNALMAGSYLLAAQVLERPDLREVALLVLERLYRDRYLTGQGVSHMGPHGRSEALVFLDAQVSFARALVEAFLATGDRRHLTRSQDLAADLVVQLGDLAGGFFDRPQNASEGLLRFPQKPLTDNLRAAMLFSDLFYLSGHQPYRDEAERTLSLVLAAGDALPIAQAGLAVDRYVRYPLHIVVVGRTDHEPARRLFTRAQQVYVPGKIVRLLDPRHDVLALGGVTFPRTERPTAYVCTDRFCSKPIEDPDDLANRVEVVRNALTHSRSRME